MTVFLTVYLMIGMILGLFALHERGKEKKNDLFDKIGLPLFASVTWFGFLIFLIFFFLKFEEKA